ncbi:MAG: N-acetyltransferase [Roseovarius sp.]
MTYDTVFGTDDQRAVLRRGRAMATLLGADTPYTYYGRTVGLVSPKEGDVDQLAALATAQGNAAYGAVPLDEVDALKADLQARGLVPMQYDRWEGAHSAISAAREAVATLPLPGDLRLVRLDASTPDADLASLAQMALGCGVLPLCGEALRGLLQLAICLAAVDPAGTVVSCAAASAFAHRDHPTHGGQAWWGMLATAPERRGARLSLVLGAQALLDMQTRFGFESFMTGVEPGNAPSQSVCTRMGLARGTAAIIGCADPRAVAGGRMTK